MSDSIDDVLVYAIALGHGFKLYEPLPGKVKKKAFKELTVPDLFDHKYNIKQRAEPLAYFIASQMQDKKVSVAKSAFGKGSFLWTVASGSSGAYLQFIAPGEGEVRRQAQDASGEKVDPKLGAFDAAVACMFEARRKREADVVLARQATRSWPPVKGSREEQAIALASNGVDFRSYPMKRWSLRPVAARNSSKAALLSKLKDPFFHLVDIEIDTKAPFDYLDGSKVVIAQFCDSNDPKDVPIIAYEWVALPTRGDDGDGQEPVVTSKARAKSR